MRKFVKICFSLQVFLCSFPPRLSITRGRRTLLQAAPVGSFLSSNLCTLYITNSSIFDFYWVLGKFSKYYFSTKFSLTTWTETESNCSWRKISREQHCDWTVSLLHFSPRKFHYFTDFRLFFINFHFPTHFSLFFRFIAQVFRNF